MNLKTEIFLLSAIIGLVWSCSGNSKQLPATVKTAPSVAALPDSNTFSYINTLHADAFDLSIHSELICSKAVKLDSQNKVVAVKPVAHPERLRLNDYCDFELIRQTIQFSRSGETVKEFSNQSIIQELRKAFPEELFDFQSVVEYVHLLDNGHEKYVHFSYNSGLSGGIDALYSPNGKLEWLKMSSKEWTGETKDLRKVLAGLHFSSVDQMTDSEGYFKADYLKKCQSLTIVNW